MPHAQDISGASEASDVSGRNQDMGKDVIEDGSPDAFDQFESNEVEFKDSTELELEKAVFGDEAGFHEQLKGHGALRDHRKQILTIQKDVDDEIEDDLRDINDADVGLPPSSVLITSKRS